MPLTYEQLDFLRNHHPAWRLLRAKHAPLVASFLHRIFVLPNVRNVSQAELTEALEDTLFSLREQLGEAAFPDTAQNYLNDWSENDKGWLRKFYPDDSDEPHFDLTPATEKALSWLDGLTAKQFIGTESRLLTLFELLRQMRDGSQTDPQAHLDELRKRRAEIDDEMARITAGELPLLDEVGLKDRFQQFTHVARELLSDFRGVEDNFRQLDRNVRERIAKWEGAKGELLAEIMGERDSINDSDQGKSFRAFWDFLMSQSRQEELSELLVHILSLPPVQAMQPDARLHHIHYDWLSAGEQTQRTVAKLSEQLRRFLDDQAWLENRRIMDILHRLENHAIGVRENQPGGTFCGIDATAADIELPLERPLYRVPLAVKIADNAIDAEAVDVDLSALYNQVTIDHVQLRQNIRKSLRNRSQISLAEVIEQYPLSHGLAELLGYLQIAGDWENTTIDEQCHDNVSWQSEDGKNRKAKLPRMILLNVANQPNNQSKY